MYPFGAVERSATLVVYLEDAFEGGETVFPRIATPGSLGNGLLESVPAAGDEVWPSPTEKVEDFCGKRSDALKVKPAVGGAVLFFG